MPLLLAITQARRRAAWRVTGPCGQVGMHVPQGPRRVCRTQHGLVGDVWEARLSVARLAKEAGGANIRLRPHVREGQEERRQRPTECEPETGLARSRSSRAFTTHEQGKRQPWSYVL